MRDNRTVWDVWLLVLAAVLGIGGLVLAVAPGLTRTAFGLFAYGDARALDALGAETVHYLTLAHGVLASALVLLCVSASRVFVPLGYHRYTMCCTQSSSMESL